MDEPSQEILPPEHEDNPPPELASSEFRELMAVEKQRLDVSNRRTEVVRFMVEANDAADKRQFDFQMAKLLSKEREFGNAHSLLRSIVYIGGGAAVLIVAFLFYMAFLGDAIQSSISLKILRVFGTGLGGAGIFRLLNEGIKRLMQKQHD